MHVARVENIMKREGTQVSEPRTISHLGDLGVCSPGKFGFFDPKECFLRPSDSSFEVFLLCNFFFFFFL